MPRWRHKVADLTGYYIVSGNSGALRFRRRSQNQPRRTQDQSVASHACTSDLTRYSQTAPRKQHYAFYVFTLGGPFSADLSTPLSQGDINHVHNQETSIDYVMMHDALLAAAGAFIQTLLGPNGRWRKSSRAVRSCCNKTEMSASAPQTLWSWHCYLRRCHYLLRSNGN